MEIISSSSHHMGGVSGAGGGGDDEDPNKDRGKKPLLQQQKESQPSKGKKTKGRVKIEIKPIENEQARLSTFSKRRSGVYKKASDIASHTGAKVAIVGITPAERFFSYGNPNVESVVERFLQQQQRRHAPQRQGVDQVVDNIVEAHRRVRVEHLNTNQRLLEEQVEEERLKSERLTEINRPFMEQNPNPCWWDLENLDDLPDELQETAAQDLQEARRQVAVFRQMLQLRNIMLPPPPDASFFEFNQGGGGGSGQEPMQDGAQWMMMEDPSSAPSSSSAPPPPPPDAAFFEFNQGGGVGSGEGMQGGSQWMMMDDIVMEDPCSSSSAAPAMENRNEEEVVDEEEMMFRLFFGEDPPTPPGPF